MNIQTQYYQQLCIKVLDALKANLTQVEYEQAHAYIYTYGEWGLGVEMIIDWLTDKQDIPLSLQQYNLLYDALKAMDKQHPYLDSLKTLWVQR